MRYASLFICGLAFSGCNSAPHVAADRAANEGRFSAASIERANNIKTQAAAEARLMCANSSNFSDCYQTAYTAKIAAVREALFQRQDQRQLEAARVVANSDLLRHGTVSCSYYENWSSCSY